MFNRFFGQKPQEDAKQNQGAAQERAGGTAEEPAPEQRFGFLQRTRQIFSRINNTVEQSDIITDTLWDELEEELMAAVETTGDEEVPKSKCTPWKAAIVKMSVNRSAGSWPFVPF